ncbi:hypothetical protein [Flavitalea sp.]|nr:hypothetical protein [Flavitalea sp.]
MRRFLLSVICFLMIAELKSQDDFIVLKKRNNRTLKTYGQGSFLSAKTNTGFQLNGFITAIRNDSVFIRQQETKLVSTEFGQTIDTVFYTFGFDHRNITAFYFSNQYGPTMRKRGFAQTTLPIIMIAGGTGYIILELVNTVYRKESLNEGNKLLSLGIAAGIAGTGILLQTLNNRKDKVGNKYKVHYVRNARGK